METEKLILNRRDMYHLKMAMLKQEETFKQQLHELHRLYQAQKMLMRDAARNKSPNYMRVWGRVEARLGIDPGRPGKFDDKSDLELTLGPRSYYLAKVKPTEPALESDSGPSFSSTSTGSGHARSAAFNSDEFSGQQKLCGPEMPVLNVSINQDRLNSSPWLFRALSFDIT